MITPKQEKRESRKRRIRARVTGTAERPRLAVFRSNKHFSAQIIDDTRGVTLSSATTVGKKNKDIEALAKELAKAAQKAGVTAVVFDRGGFLYTGTIKRFADTIREAGLEF